MKKNQVLKIDILLHHNLHVKGMNQRINEDTTMMNEVNCQPGKQ